MKLDKISTQEQSRREFDRQVRQSVHEAIEEGRDSITIYFEALAEDTSSTGQYEDVTLRNLYNFWRPA